MVRLRRFKCTKSTKINTDGECDVQNKSRFAEISLLIRVGGGSKKCKKPTCKGHLKRYDLFSSGNYFSPEVTVSNSPFFFLQK